MGVKGGVKPNWNAAACTFCGVCQTVCPQKIIDVDKIARTVTFDEAAYVYCGRCVKSCPTDSWQGQNGFIVSFGGLYGNRIAVGENFLPIIFDESKLYQKCDVKAPCFSYGDETPPLNCVV